VQNATVLNASANHLTNSSMDLVCLETALQHLLVLKEQTALQSLEDLAIVLVLQVSQQTQTGLARMYVYCSTLSI